MALGQELFSELQVGLLGREATIAVDKFTQELIGMSDKNELFMQTYKNLLSAKQRLEQQEEAFLNKIGCNSVEEFRSKLSKFYNNTGYGILTGEELNKAFVAPYVSKLNKEQEKMEQFLLKILSAKLPADAERNSQNIADALHPTITAMFKQLQGGNVKVKTTYSTKAFGEEGMGAIAMKELTPVFKQRVREIMEAMEEGKQFNGLEDINFTAEINGNIMDLQTESEWYDATGGFKASEAKALYANDPEGLAQANMRIVNLIKSKIGGNAPYLDTIINQMLAKDSTMFFVGANANKITGLLGEISAVAGLYDLCNGKKSISSLISWVATNRSSSGGELSIDVLLDRLFGIQVKNTTKSGIENTITIVSLNPAKVMEKLNGIENSDVLGSLITSYGFNVPFYKRGSAFVEGHNHHVNENFVSVVRPLIDRAYQKLRISLASLSPQFLFLDNSAESQLANLNKEVANINGNIIYLVGNKPYFGSEMINDILLNIKELQHYKEEAGRFQMSSYLQSKVSGVGSMNTIVQFYNTYSHAGTAYASNYSPMMTSSYTFD